MNGLQPISPAMNVARVPTGQMPIPQRATWHGSYTGVTPAPPTAVPLMTRGRDLRHAAAQFVSDGLVAPALSTLHQSPLRPKSGPFAPSSLERRFAPLLEAHLAERVTQAANFPLVDTIVKRFESLDERRTGGASP